MYVYSRMRVVRISARKREAYSLGQRDHDNDGGGGGCFLTAACTVYQITITDRW